MRELDLPIELLAPLHTPSPSSHRSLRSAQPACRATTEAQLARCVRDTPPCPGLPRRPVRALAVILSLAGVSAASSTLVQPPLVDVPPGCLPPPTVRAAALPCTRMRRRSLLEGDAPLGLLLLLLLACSAARAAAETVDLPINTARVWLTTMEQAVAEVGAAAEANGTPSADINATITRTHSMLAAGRVRCPSFPLGCCAAGCSMCLALVAGPGQGPGHGPLSIAPRLSAHPRLTRAATCKQPAMGRWLTSRRPSPHSLTRTWPPAGKCALGGGAGQGGEEGGDPLRCA